MENAAHESLIRAYVRKELSASERAQFELKLKTDIVLQKAYLSFCLQSEGAKEFAMEDRFREMAESIKAEIGPLSEPRLSWWDHIRFAMYEPVYRGVATGTGLVLGTLIVLVIWANSGALDTTKVVSTRYLMLPECLIRDQEKAGKHTPDHYAEMNALWDRSKRFYCDGQLDSLRLQPDTIGVTNYFLAHLQLKNEDWNNAQQALERCLSNQPFLQQFSTKIDPAEIRFNSLLAQLGNTGKYRSMAKDFTQLSKEPTTGQLVKDRIRALQGEMESPLRWFYFL